MRQTFHSSHRFTILRVAGFGVCSGVNSVQQHQPVLLDEVIKHLGCTPGKLFVDGTVGGGGHARAILDRTAPDGRLVGVDWDETALNQARLNLRSYSQRLILVRDNYAHMGSILARLQIQAVDGILLDLGLSSLQVDAAERGFSFSQPGPLDMRMDKRRTTSAADLIHDCSEEELAEIIHKFGEERWSRRIARKIVRTRAEATINSTQHLAETIVAAIPPDKRSRKRHPATRTFQALRMAVNQEIGNLQTFLRDALNWLRPGGRLAIISFHSLEDRLVKHTFAEWARPCRCPTQVPVCHCEGAPLARLVLKRPLVPTPEEIKANPRARSGRLRLAEKIQLA